MTPSLEGCPTKTKEAPSPHDVRLAPLDTSPVFQSLGGKESGCTTFHIWLEVLSKLSQADPPILEKFGHAFVKNSLMSNFFGDLCYGYFLKLGITFYFCGKFQVPRRYLKF